MLNQSEFFLMSVMWDVLPSEEIRNRLVAIKPSLNKGSEPLGNGSIQIIKNRTEVIQ